MNAALEAGNPLVGDGCYLCLCLNCMIFFISSVSIRIHEYLFLYSLCCFIVWCEILYHLRHVTLCYMNHYHQACFEISSELSIALHILPTVSFLEHSAMNHN